MEKIYYFLKLNPPRSTFMQDMTDVERDMMMQHIAYWKPFVDDGTMLVMGPVLDPKGGYGVGILAVENEERLEELLAADPVNGLHEYEYYQMMAVTK